LAYTRRRSGHKAQDELLPLIVRGTFDNLGKMGLYRKARRRKLKELRRDDDYRETLEDGIDKARALLEPAE
jgi:hypothetical protein